MLRHDNRKYDENREISFIKNFTKYAEGSVLSVFGNTKVLCTATIEKSIPHFLRDKLPKQGWITAEYGMLPRSTHTRMARESAKGKQSGRTQEIQRLIGRSLRAMIDLLEIPGYTIKIDCDVLQADGGTRTAAISGACVAVNDAINYMVKNDMIDENNKAIISNISAISVGMYEGVAILDLDYIEDSNAETDMNVVMNDKGGIIEIQGTAEKQSFSSDELNKMLQLAKIGCENIFKKQ